MIITFLLLIHSIYGQYNNLPGVEQIILSYNLLTNKDVQTILKMTYSGRSVCHKGTCYNLPNEISFYELNQCDTRGQTEIIRNKDEWKKSYSTKVSISTDSPFFGDISGSYSKEYKTFNSNTNEYQSATASAFVGCDEYEIIARPLEMKLSNNFYTDVSNLPDEFNQETMHLYFKFFDTYGTTWIHRVKFGGRMYGDSFTKYTYTKSVSETTITEQISASFFAQITHETQYSSKLTQEYNQSSHHYEISTYGGSYFDPTNKDITTWTATIPQAPVITFKELYLISDLFNGAWVNDPNLLKYYNPIKTALNYYYNVTGCTDSKADNYDSHAVIDDGSCDYVYSYTNEYMITSQTPNPDATGIKLIQGNDGFCFLTFIENCQQKCRVETDIDGFWYLRSYPSCATASGNYCGARCAYTNPVVGSGETNHNYIISMNSNPTAFSLCDILQMNRIAHSSQAFCYAGLTDVHAHCRVQIDNDGYWYITAEKRSADGKSHRCSTYDLCQFYCAYVKFEKSNNIVMIPN